MHARLVHRYTPLHRRRKVTEMLRCARLFYFPRSANFSFLFNCTFRALFFLFIDRLRFREDV